MKVGVSVGILVKNQSENISRCIRSIEWPQNIPVELLVVDHGSIDGTVESAKHARPEHIPIKIFHGAENNLGLSRNFLLGAAQYSCLVFIDSDCEAGPGWLQGLYEQLWLAKGTDNKIIGVGGANIPPATRDPFYRSLRVMFSSVVGNGNSPQAKTVTAPELVRHLPTCNLALDTSAARSVGGFSADFAYVSEDLEFSRRAVKNGHRFLFLPNNAVWHWHRVSYIAWFKKMFRYGRGQVLVQRKHPWHLLGTRAAPLLFVVALIVLAILDFNLFLICGIAYLAILLLFSSYLCLLAKGPDLIGSVFYLTFGSHVFYGLGELFELFNIRGCIQHREVNQKEPNNGFILFEKPHKNAESSTPTQP